MLPKRGERGFTLIELLIVLGIIAVLAAIAVPAVTGYIKRAKQRAWESDKEIIENAVKAYYVDYGKFPTWGDGAYGKPGWDSDNNRFKREKGAIKMSLIVGADKYLSETPESASWTNGGSGSYTWYVKDSAGNVWSCGPDEDDSGYQSGIYP